MNTAYSRRAVIAAGLAVAASGEALGRVSAAPTRCAQWDMLELAFEGPEGWTPSADAPLTAIFEQGETRFTVAGFWDGGRRYRVRFMPPAQGAWRWRTQSASAALNGLSGGFRVRAPQAGNHGPVRVSETYHFAYADGTPFRQLGTTSYAWSCQPPARRADTLRTLAAAPFNKIRMLVFPNSSTTIEPLFPFERAGESWDFARINPAFFQRLDQSVASLTALGVEADIILFHPYDDARGFSAMSPAQDEIYLRYLIARIGAYRNVWWSAANEWDLVKAKTEADFDRVLQIVQSADPYGHMRSIHNWRTLYDHNKPWITHASIQNGAAVEDDARALLYRDVYRKPVIFDEVRYEGNIEERWGNLTAEQMVSAFWHAHIAGSYCGHGEVIRDPVHGAWLGAGGRFHGQSPPRLAFLKRVMEEGPAPGIDPLDRWWGRHIAGKSGQYYLRYFGEDTPAEWRIDVPKDELTGGERFRVDVLDTWGMSATPAGEVTLSQTGPYSFGDPARPTISLPGRPWMAVRLARI